MCPDFDPIPPLVNICIGIKKKCIKYGIKFVKFSNTLKNSSFKMGQRFSGWAFAHPGLPLAPLLTEFSSRQVGP